VSSLLLIRHGQASLGAVDYDVLSPLGVTQSRRLGEHLGGMLRPDLIVTGPRLRQRDTAAHLVAAARARGADYPDPIERPEFDEYPALVIMQRHLQRLAQGDELLAAPLAELQRHPRGSREQRRAFEAAFQRMMRRWHDDELDDPEIEPAAAFAARIERGLRELLAPRGRSVLVVSSAGPVGIGLRLGLGLDLWAGLKASFVVHNSSISELRTRGEEPVLTMFNALPHLHDPAEITLR